MSVDTQTTPPAADPGFSGDQKATTVSGAVREYVDKIRGGDMGALPAVLGLIVLLIVFSAIQPDTFPSPRNIANLTVQAGAICVLAMGLVPVLLLGDIDLSAGVAGGTASAVTALALANHGQSWPVAVLAGILTGAVIGVLIGIMVAKIGIPAFVVTLAFFLGLQGVNLKLIGDGASIPVRNETILNISNNNVNVTLGWILAIVAIVLYGLLTLRKHQVQVKRGLQHGPLALVLARIGGLALIVVAFTAILSVDRAPAVGVVLAGVPWVVPVVVVLLIVLTFVFSKTSYGRHVYAVGGNREAGRRAGINVDAIRVSVFAIASSMAAISGIITASRLNGVSPDAGAGNTLLYAVGAAVIGGTSLFGGRGKVRDAVIGGFVIATIDNGLGLLGQPAYVKFIVTGVVLLIAASVDALSRRRRTVTGT
ncbi:sugar ABC transporter permease [Solicola sp. PLA-1-18]|uniref:sugar ABC transporter permease n=1 Tax=Solicola sp. PLA-1-18 TaxID=3380532 RepID=UPI003B7F6CA9